MPTDTSATASRDRVERRTAQAQENADHKGGGMGLLVVAGGLAAIGVYELMKGKGAPAAPTAACPKPGSLAQDPAGAVWVIAADGKKRHVASADAMNSCGYDRNKIVKVTDAALAQCPTGADVTAFPDCPPGPLVSCPAPGQIVQIPNGPTWLVDPTGKLRGFPSGDIFNACGYDWSKIISIPAHAVDHCTFGPNITGPPDCPPGPKVPPPPPAPTQTCGIDQAIAGAVCYEILGGDTLIWIAQKMYGAQYRSDNNLIWVQLLNDNMNTLTQVANQHGFAGPATGHWIFPGTRIQCRRVLTSNGVARP